MIPYYLVILSQLVTVPFFSTSFPGIQGSLPGL